MKLTSKMLAVAAVLFFLPLAAAQAFTARAGDTVNLVKGEIVEGSLYVAGANINIDGKVTGDVVCAGQTVNISGEVLGDVVCAGQTVNISGRVIGNVRSAASSINLTGQVGKNVTVAAASVNTSASSTVGWEMLFASALADLKGRVSYDLVGVASGINLSGSVGKDVKLRLDNRDANQVHLIVGKTAVIDGKLTYTDSKPATIEPGATIAGETVRQDPPKNAERRSWFLAWLWSTLLGICAAFIIGLVLLTLWPNQVEKISQLLKEKTLKSLGWGAVITLLTPIIIILLFVSFVGIYLGLFTGMIWLLLLWLGKIVSAYTVGEILREKMKIKTAHPQIIGLLIGVVLFWMIFALPGLGLVASFFACLFGVGAIWLRLLTR
ncbi:MAG: polymer-forming cytoskeletal protein [Candidatus Falkowbacteria bacterium]